MIHTLGIENFRGFKKLDASPLTAVNVVVGPNGSGKTSLLESIFLTSGNTPENTLKVRAWRGLGELVAIGPGSELWEDFFFDVGVGSFAIRLQDTSAGERAFRAERVSGTAMEIPAGGGAPTYTPPIRFFWSIDGKDQEARVTVHGERLRIEAVPILFQSVFITPRSVGMTETANRFSKLIAARNEQGVVEHMTTVFDWIDELVLGTEFGIPTVFASVRGLQNKRLPLPLVSEGISKYLAILVALHEARGGVVLIDEIESGLFHSSLAQIWRGIVAEANILGTQVFVTTHSLEALRAALPALSDSPEQFTLLRMRRDVRDGTCHATPLSGTRAKAAIEEGFEVR